MQSEQSILKQIQVNIPFRMLEEPGYRSLFSSQPLNPEIGLDAIALDQFNTGDYEAAAEWLTQLNRRVTVHGPFMDLSAGSMDPAIRSITRHRLTQLAKACEILKPVHVVCHAGYESRRHQFYKNEWLSYSIDMWSWLAGELAKSGCRLVLENVYEDGPEELLPLLNGLASSGVGFCLDTGHHMAFGSSPLSDWLDMLGDRLNHIHWHDNAGDLDLHLPPGQGIIDFAPLIQFLSEQKKPGLPVITLEPHEETDFWPAVEYLKSVWCW